MKFWQKIFLSTMIIFILAFDAGVYIIANYAYQYNLQQERDRSLSERHIIASGLSGSIRIYEEETDFDSTDVKLLKAAFMPYVDYYRNHGILMELFLDGELIYSNGPRLTGERSELKMQKSTSISRWVNERKFLYTSGPVPGYPRLTLVYIRALDGLEAFKLEFIRIFKWVSIGVCLFLALTIYLLLKLLTSPIKALSTAASKIAEGNYNERVSIKSRDELGSLANNFNMMAQAIQERTESLLKAAEEKQRFVDNLAHELRTPLTAIKGYAEYLQNAHCSEKDRIKAAGYLAESAERLQDLSSKLLNIAHLRAHSLKAECIHISSLFADLKDTMKNVLLEKNISLYFEDKLGKLWGDKILLLSLLTNLVDNAVKASESGSSITVKAYMKDFPVLEVIDQGKGMEPSEINKVFEPFYRVDKSRSRKDGGVGLGLALCSQIAELHQAKLSISSEVGKGTTVTLSFTTSLQDPNKSIK